jgi:hypothetical protein
MIGEKHLLILSNTDHSLLTGLPKVNPRSQPTLLRYVTLESASIKSRACLQDILFLNFHHFLIL